MATPHAAQSKDELRPGLHSPGALRAQAERCRRLAADVEGDPAALLLARLALTYEDEAFHLERNPT